MVVTTVVEGDVCAMVLVSTFGFLCVMIEEHDSNITQKHESSDVNVISFFILNRSNSTL